MTHVIEKVFGLFKGWSQQRDITDNIYVVLPRGARPIFRPTTIDPGYTVSSPCRRAYKYHGYQEVPGGKGSHVTADETWGAEHSPSGQRNVLSPEVTKQAVKAIEDYPLSRLPDLVQGRLAH